ncbi:MAG: hypothetical protein KGO51_08390 [Alphaproteobacteria bacterium]|nr:hypothetical protein [Alphaproteobacteria bacterium]
MKAALALIILATALGGCQTTTTGASRLAGQDLDAAVALYGPWSDEIVLKGRPLYIWRRTLIANGEPQVCEFRVELGFRRQISRAYMQGVPAACRLYAVKSEMTTN